MHWLATAHAPCLHVVSAVHRQAKPGRGAQSALTVITTLIHQTIDNGDSCNLVLIDFSKAFDKVTPSQILNRLQALGASTNCTRWICSFLCNREVCVKVNNVFSSFKKPSSGIPQGSVIAPLLFAFFISSLQPSTQSCKFFKYADDLTVVHYVYKTDLPVDSSINGLQVELEHINKWCSDNQMTINTSKTCYISFGRKMSREPSINGQTISCVDSAELLGITLTSDLKWNQHIHKVTAKSKKRLFPLVTLCRAGCRAPMLWNFYNTMIRSVLMYCYSAFCNIPHYLWKELQKVEKRAFVIIKEAPNVNLVAFSEKLCHSFASSVNSNTDHPFRKFLIKRIRHCHRKTPS